MLKSVRMFVRFCMICQGYDVSLSRNLGLPGLVALFFVTETTILSQFFLVFF